MVDARVGGREAAARRPPSVACHRLWYNRPARRDHRLDLARRGTSGDGAPAIASRPRHGRPRCQRAPVAQRSEQRPHKAWVVGSNPTRRPGFARVGTRGSGDRRRARGPARPLAAGTPGGPVRVPVRGSVGSDADELLHRVLRGSGAGDGGPLGKPVPPVVSPGIRCRPWEGSGPRPLGGSPRFPVAHRAPYGSAVRTVLVPTCRLTAPRVHSARPTARGAGEGATREPGMPIREPMALPTARGRAASLWPRSARRAAGIRLRLVGLLRSGCGKPARRGGPGAGWRNGRPWVRPRSGGPRLRSAPGWGGA